MVFLFLFVVIVFDWVDLLVGDRGGVGVCIDLVGGVGWGELRVFYRDGVYFGIVGFW